MRGKQRVVVITGGSSGLGRATAVEFARKGDFVVVAARRPVDLEETVRLCRAAGGDGLAVVTDVTRLESLDHLVQQVLREKGRIDVWVNNAAVTLFAALDQASFAEHRAVLETNLLGPMAAARLVAPVFRQQGHGTMINVGSVLSQVAQSFVPAYVVSKHGLRGLTDALRAYFADEPNVHVCGIYPFTIDTPHFEAAASDLEHPTLAIPPVQAPEKVAQAVVRLAARPRREVYVPRAIVLGLAAHWLLPQTTERLLLHALRRWHFAAGPQERTRGTLFQPPDDGQGRIHGHRRPQLGVTHFGAWVARDFVRSEVGALRERVRGARARRSSSRAHP